MVYGIDFIPPLSDPPPYFPPSGNPEIVYVDEFLFVVVKPSGLLAVPGRGADKQDCMISRLQQQFNDALVVHRLDMATSGLMVFARGAQVQKILSLMFQEHTVLKTYIAVVSGKLLIDEGEINLPIAADWVNRPRHKIDHQSGKPSLTRYSVLEYDSFANTSVVRLIPVSGRTHQLRLHLAAIGHPILGDSLYGVASSATRLMLHAFSLEFAHPISGQVLNFTNPALSEISS